MNRTKRGYIMIQEQKHFVYDGLNLIGRNKGATVIIPDTSVSHYHCVIVIINDQHFLSDTNSSNGTYLKQSKLLPLQLFELDVNTSIKFGLVEAKYFKLSNGSDSVLEDEENNDVVIEEDIFKAATQIYDHSCVNNVQNLDNMTVNADSIPEFAICNESTRENAVTISINDLPTQILGNKDDDEFSADSEKDQINSDINNEKMDILINDLPTQIVTNTEDNEDTFEAEKSNFYQTSDVIEETIIDDNHSESCIEETGENSRESTDFLTMQPASSQHSLESQSQLYVQQLQRRIRNVILSSDEDSNSFDENYGSGKSLKTVLNNSSSSDDETDVESPRSKPNKFVSKRKPVIDSDSGDSTDAETQLNSLVTKKTLSRDNKDSSSDTDIGSSNEDKLRTSLVTKNLNETTSLNDSDMIPATQDRPVPKNSNGHSNVEITEMNNVTRPNVSSKDPSQNATFEASLNDSFQLVLTNSPSSVQVEQTNDALPSNDDNFSHKYGVNNKSKISDEDVSVQAIQESEIRSVNNDQVRNSEPFSPLAKSTESVCETQHTQLEVSFDSQNLQVEVDDGRPLNPLVNVFEGNQKDGSTLSDTLTVTPSTYDSVEEKLSKIFQPTMQVHVEETDDIFMLPTQIVQPTDNSNKEKEENRIFKEPLQVLAGQITGNSKQALDDDLFLQPTQILDPTGQDATASVGNFDTKRSDTSTAVTIDHDQKVKDQQSVHVTNSDEQSKNQILQPENMDKEENTIFKRPLQVLANKKDNVIHNQIIGNSKQTLEDDDFFLQPTQILDSTNQDTTASVDNFDTKRSDSSISDQQSVHVTDSDEQSKNQILQPKKMDREESTIFKRPLQVLANKKDNIIHNQITGNSKQALEDDIFLQPTQILDPTGQNAIADNILTKRNDTSITVTIDHDQKVKDQQSVHVTNSGEQLKNQILQPEQMDKKENAIFKKPLQVLANKEDNLIPNQITGNSKQTLDDDFYLQPTQILHPTSQVTTASVDNSDTKRCYTSTAVTISYDHKVKDQQSVHVVNSDEQSKDQILQSGKMDDDIFLQPTQLVSTCKTVREKNQIPNPKLDVDDIFLLPTQILETQDENINNCNLDKSKENSNVTDIHNPIRDNTESGNMAQKHLTSIANETDIELDNNIASTSTEDLETRRDEKVKDFHTKERDSPRRRKLTGENEMARKQKIEKDEDTVKSGDNVDADSHIKVENIASTSTEDLETRCVEDVKDFHAKETDTPRRRKLTREKEKAQNEMARKQKIEKEEDTVKSGDNIDADSHIKVENIASTSTEDLETRCAEDVKDFHAKEKDTPRRRKLTRGKEKTQDETAKKQKIENDEDTVKSEGKILRRSKRKQSSEAVVTMTEREILNKTDAQDEKLHVIKEICDLTDELSTCSTNSEDEFQVSPQMSVNVKQIPLKKQKLKEIKTDSDTPNRRSKRKTVMQRESVNVAALADEENNLPAKQQKRENESNTTTADISKSNLRRSNKDTLSPSSCGNVNDSTSNSSTKKSKILREKKKVESKDKNEASSSSVHIAAGNIATSKTRRSKIVQVENNSEDESSSGSVNTTDNITNIRTRKSKTNLYEKIQNNNENESCLSFSRTRKSKIIQEEQRQNINEDESSSTSTNTTATNYKTRKSKMISEEEEQNNNENKPCSSSSNTINNITSGRTRKSKMMQKEQGQNINEFQSSSSLTNTTTVTTGSKTRKSKMIQEEKGQKDNGSGPSSSSPKIGQENSENKSCLSSNNTSGRIKKSQRAHAGKNINDDESSTSCIKIKGNITNSRTRKSKMDREEKKQTHNEGESASDSSSIAENVNDSKRRKLYRVSTSEDEFEIKTDNKKRRDKGQSSSAGIPSTPERNKRKLKPKIVFTMLDSPELETIIRSLGGSVVDSVEASTVLLTSNVKRSQKLLSAVGQAKPICAPKWLHDCKKANTFLDPWDYILEDKEAEKKWNFSLKESLKRSSSRKLFENYTFQLMANAAQDVLKGSIESCGGKCVSRAPSKDSSTNFVVVASPENKSKYARFLKQTPVPTIVAAEAIFDGVLRQELHFEDHLLT